MEHASDYGRRVGVAIAAARCYRGITRSQLAAAAGMSTAMVGRYERGTPRPDTARLRLLAEALALPLELFTDPPPNRRGAFWELVHLTETSAPDAAHLRVRVAAVDRPPKGRRTLCTARGLDEEGHRIRFAGEPRDLAAMAAALAAGQPEIIALVPRWAVLHTGGRSVA